MRLGTTALHSSTMPAFAGHPIDRAAPRACYEFLLATYGFVYSVHQPGAVALRFRLYLVYRSACF